MKAQVGPNVSPFSSMLSQQFQEVWKITLSKKTISVVMKATVAASERSVITCTVASEVFVVTCSSQRS